MPGQDRNSPASSPEANDAARAMLFSQGFFSSIELPSQAWANGASYAFQLPHAGIGLYASLRMTGEVAWAGTVAPSLSLLAPFNIFQSIKYVDYLGNTRINAGGPALHTVEVLKSYNDTSGEVANSTSKRGYHNPLVDVLNVPGTASANEPYDFALQVPFSAHENTTVGTIPFTVPAGNNVLYVTLNPVLNNSGTANAESPLQGAATTTGATLTGNVFCTYYYIDPLPGQALPLMDFAQVYEIVDVKSTDNLSSSATKQIILPTGRTYQALYGQLVNAGTYTDTGVTELRFLINESTPTLDEKYVSYLHRIRRTYGRDLEAGVFCWDLRARPISPQNYGSIALQTLFDSTFVPSGETFYVLTKESLYVLQTNLY